MNVIRADKPYTRKNVGGDHKNMYIFTDNTDRDSGKSLIPKGSWYSKKYGEGKHYPSMKTTWATLGRSDNPFASFKLSERVIRIIPIPP